MGFSLKKLNPFSSQGTLGRAILTGGASLVPELVVKKALDATKPTDPGAPAALGAPINPQDEMTARAMEEAQRQQRNAQGRSSTILSGGRGILQSGSIARRTLLGA